MLILADTFGISDVLNDFVIALLLQQKVLTKRNVQTQDHSLGAF